MRDPLLKELLDKVSSNAGLSGLIKACDLDDLADETLLITTLRKAAEDHLKELYDADNQD